MQRCACISVHSSREECVLIRGETGTGKEAFARAFGEPFVAINCTSLPDYLVESELFGHVAGAYTGAIRDKVGLFVHAGEGTLFLDEIGDMPQHLQAKLLRVLQQRTVRRVGDNAETAIQCRVVAATHQSTTQRLREDLLMRLSTHELYLTPLRDRVCDIELYVSRKASEYLEHLPAIVDAVKELGGNYRRLQQTIARLRINLVMNEAGTPPAQ